MTTRQTNQFIGLVVLGIAGYYLVQLLLPYLIMGAIGWVLWRLSTGSRRP